MKLLARKDEHCWKAAFLAVSTLDGISSMLTLETVVPFGMAGGRDAEACIVVEEAKRLDKEGK